MLSREVAKIVVTRRDRILSFQSLEKQEEFYIVIKGGEEKEIQFMVNIWPPNL